MVDLFQYLDWRGDLSFKQVPFGPVDAMVLTTMCYAQFRDILPEGPENSVTLEEAAKAFLALPKREREIRVRSRLDEDLLTRLLECPRFSQLPISCHVDKLEEEGEMQFAAMAIHLGDEGVFLAFRGTDNTLVGWKEDFNMTFQPAVPAQWMARDYLEQCAGWFEGKLLLGGHSKGGNLSVFSGAMCREQVRKRISAIYNYDGPGFGDLVMNSDGYQQLLPRIHTYIPQSSVVGMLLEHREPYVVVKSRQIGVFQHDPYSWEIRRDNFVYLKGVTEGSRMMDQTVKTWLEEMTPSERSEIVDTVYEMLQTTEADRVQELLHPKSIYHVIKAFAHEDEHSRKLLAEALGQFAKTAVHTARELRKAEK